jgi:hypothetical protein
MERAESGKWQSVAKNVLRNRLRFSLLNVTGTAYRLRHEQNSNHAGLGSPLPRSAHQLKRFGNTVVLFWYDRKAESLCIA